MFYIKVPSILYFRNFLLQDYKNLCVVLRIMKAFIYSLSYSIKWSFDGKGKCTDGDTKFVYTNPYGLQNYRFIKLFILDVVEGQSRVNHFNPIFVEFIPHALI